jgi:ATP-dependent Clp protease ATP-binding subunit ClpA|tara:strand:- start:1412 stop:1885 length:474 start_codon:yes stop_codon:yes gene_type:complete
MESLPIAKSKMTGSLCETLYLAKEEARTNYQEFVRTEHLLAGLINCRGTNIINEFLDIYRIDKLEILDRIELIIPGPSSFKFDSRPEFNPRTKQSLNYAEDESANMNYQKIGTGHLLLGLIREPSGFAGELLRDNLGMELNSARNFVEEYYRLRKEI